MLWKPDPAIDAARQRPGWREFHRECGREALFFDHMVKERKVYVATAFTATRRRDHFATEKLAEGRGATPIDALVEAYRATGRVVPAAEPHLSVMTDEFGDLLG